MPFPFGPKIPWWKKAFVWLKEKASKLKYLAEGTNLELEFLLLLLRSDSKASKTTNEKK